MALIVAAPKPAAAQAEPFLGQLMLFAGNFCPRGWADASGQLLSISQNTALFSILGTMYGGNGQTTFGLPDLRGRVPISAGQAPGLSNYVEGQTGGGETLTVQLNNMPPHSHAVGATTRAANRAQPGGKLLASSDVGINTYHVGPPNRTMDPAMIGVTGGGQPIGHRGPYLTLRWCIAIEGIFPPRD
jgi:microcystin-dependent protein